MVPVRVPCELVLLDELYESLEQKERPLPGEAAA
jgi:hypothetical protein